MIKNITKEDHKNKIFQDKLNNELFNILKYWVVNTVDKEHGGFIGQIDHDNNKIYKANKAIVLNARILWSFSRASNFLGNDNYKNECERAYNYLKNYFLDTVNGGVFWELDYEGQPVNKRKQTYAQAFTIYALAEYYKYDNHQDILDMALGMFNILEDIVLDKENSGYIEAFSHDWEAIDDMRLSNKDINAPKTMNTHLHILEAYTTLYEVSKNERVGAALGKIIKLFLEKFVTPEGHFSLFFSMEWENCSDEVSYGHDIEAGWLLLNAASILNDKDLIATTTRLLISVSDTFLEEAIDSNFGVLNSKNQSSQVIDMDKHWWPQAEAVVGLTYAWNISGNPVYLESAKNIWNFIEDKIIDSIYGEWFFSVDHNGKPYIEEDKVGPWKCPYHNSRACVEVINQLRLSM